MSFWTSRGEIACQTPSIIYPLFKHILATQLLFSESRSLTYQRVIEQELSLVSHNTAECALTAGKPTPKPHSWVRGKGRQHLRAPAIAAPGRANWSQTPLLPGTRMLLVPMCHVGCKSIVCAAYAFEPEGNRAQQSLPTKSRSYCPQNAQIWWGTKFLSLLERKGENKFTFRDNHLKRQVLLKHGDQLMRTTQDPKSRDLLQDANPQGGTTQPQHSTLYPEITSLFSFSIARA